MASFLIVDEDRNFREALAIALRLEGHEASAVGDAAAARARLASAALDCCLVDVHLRGADGLLEAACRAGARAFATGPHPDLVAAAARRHPGAGALPKPLSAREVEAAVAGGTRAAARAG
ncbi:MAG TPA: response regulator [Anaeromyxobacter sp.]|nr:response regulator [Anaeromyxobacter sp.]